MHPAISHTADGAIEFVLLADQHLSGALRVFRESFLVDEKVSLVLSLAKNNEAIEQVEQLVRDVVPDGASVAAVEVSTGRVVGIAINKIQVKAPSQQPGYLEKILENDKVTPEYKGLLRFFIDIEKTADAFNFFGVDCLLDLMFLTTLKEFRGKGVGKKLVEASMVVAQEYGRTIKPKGNVAHPQPQAVIAIFTSTVSQKIGKSLNWDVLSTVSYDTLTYNGESYGNILGPNEPVCVFTGTKIL